MSKITEYKLRTTLKDIVFNETTLERDQINFTQRIYSKLGLHIDDISHILLEVARTFNLSPKEIYKKITEYTSSIDNYPSFNGHPDIPLRVLEIILGTQLEIESSKQ